MRVATLIYEGRNGGIYYAQHYFFFQYNMPPKPSYIVIGVGVGVKI